MGFAIVLSSPIDLATMRTGSSGAWTSDVLRTSDVPLLAFGSGSMSTPARKTKASAKSATKVRAKAVDCLAIRYIIYAILGFCQLAYLTNKWHDAFLLPPYFMTTKHTFQENFMRVVAVIGLIAVLLLGAWGIIQLAFFIPTFLGNIGGSLTAKNEAPKTTATTTVTTVKTAVVTETTKPVVKTPAVKSPASTKYVASPKPRAALYGYPDLAVLIINAPTSVRAGQQVSLQFIIENTGPNAVPANWYF